MERHERIARAIKASGKKKGELAAEIGVAASAVTQWITGESKSLKPENLYGLARATGFRAEWIAMGEGPEHDAPMDDNVELRASRPSHSDTPLSAGWLRAPGQRRWSRSRLASRTVTNCPTTTPKGRRSGLKSKA